MAVHGSSTFFSLDNSGGSVIDLTAKVREVNITLEEAIHDITTLGQTSQVKTVGLKNGSFTVNFIADSTVITHLNGLFNTQSPGTTTTWSFVIGPRGNTGGFEKYSGECLLTSLPVPIAVDDVERIQATFEVTAGVTIGTF